VPGRMRVLGAGCWVLGAAPGSEYALLEASLDTRGLGGLSCNGGLVADRGMEGGLLTEQDIIMEEYGKSCGCVQGLSTVNCRSMVFEV